MFRKLFPLGLVFLAAGMSTAVVLPFLALFLSTEVRAGPGRVTVFLIASPLAGVLASWVVGRLSDRGDIRRALLVVASVAGLAGTAVTAVVRDYWILLGTTVTATAVAAALFPQTFAYARQVLLRDNPARAAMGISSLRTVFSIAWVAGPPLASVLLAAGGFRLVYACAALLYGIALLVAVLLLRPIGPLAVPVTPDDEGTSAPTRPDASRPVLMATALSFVLLQTPLTLAVQALPLYVSRDLGGEVSDAGLILGLCAALEIPLMLGLGALSTRLPLRLLIVLGGLCGIAYYALVTMAGAIWMLLLGQLINAAFIAAVSGLGISYVQDLLPRAPGRATTLFTNTFPIGAMLAGPLFGLSQLFGFRLAFGLCAALAASGVALLLLTRPAAQRESAVPQPT